jgi:hypothetical protein
MAVVNRLFASLLASRTTASIQSIHDGKAQDGDIITLTAGTFTWSATVTISKAVTLQGAGIGNSIVKDAGAGNLFNWSPTAGKPSRLSSIEFQDGGRTVVMWGVSVNGSNTNGSSMRIDHCIFAHLRGFAINPSDMIGVIDHCMFLFSPGNIPVYAFHKNWNNQGPYAGGSWKDVSHFGTSQFLFLEDNTFIGDTA